MTIGISKCIENSKIQKSELTLTDDSSLNRKNSNQEILMNKQIKKKSKIDVKQLILLTILYNCVHGSVIMNFIALQNIGISNIVVNSLVMTCADFISNLIIFLYFHKIKRKKNLLCFNYILFVISVCLFAISFSPDSEIKNIINLIFSFIIKLLLMLIFVLQVLFNSNILKSQWRHLKLKTEVNQLQSSILPILFFLL